MTPPESTRPQRPWTQHQARTLFLRIATVDWVDITRGLKREYRCAPSAAGMFYSVETPTPVVAYKVQRNEYESRLMVCEERWTEPLGSITQESLAAEGFDSMAEFRRYWRRRHRTKAGAFQPFKMVECFRLRPWALGDSDRFAERLFMRLYGEFLPAGEHWTPPPQ
jgi:hypothetical protein